MKELRKGITTGTCAAAAAKAALILLKDNKTEAKVTVTLPSAESKAVKIEKVFLENGVAHAVVIKDGGDDPDVTNGAQIVAQVTWANQYKLLGGIGVGRVTKPGLAIEPGDWAINPVPRNMIHTAVLEILPEGNVEVTINVPKGEELARRTLNPKLGIVGGISILGTTGIVEPMSEEAFKNSLIPQLDMAKAAGYKNIVFVPGKMGERSAQRHLELADVELAQTSNFIGFMLEKAVDKGFQRILLWGSIAKLVKVAAGNMHTHNRVSDARFETLAAHAALLSRGDLAPLLMKCNTTEEAIAILKENHLTEVLFTIAESARKRAKEYLFGDAEIAVVFTDLQGEVISFSGNIDSFLEEAAWRKKFMW